MKRRKNVYEKTEKAMRNNAILNSYFSSFRVANFCYFAWRLLGNSSFRLVFFVFSPAIISERKKEDDKTKQNAMRNNAILK